MRQDLAALAQTATVATLGEATTYTPEGGQATAVNGIFSNTFIEVDPDLGVPISTNAPNVFYKHSDLPGEPAEGDQVTIRETNYVVSVIQKDGQDGYRLKLKLA